jgi:hypothetical protein
MPVRGAGPVVGARQCAASWHPTTPTSAGLRLIRFSMIRIGYPRLRIRHPLGKPAMPRGAGEPGAQVVLRIEHRGSRSIRSAWMTSSRAITVHARSLIESKREDGIF